MVADRRQLRGLEHAALGRTTTGRTTVSVSECQTVNGPGDDGVRPGPIVDGTPTPIPQTVPRLQVEVEDARCTPRWWLRVS